MTIRLAVAPLGDAIAGRVTGWGASPLPARSADPAPAAAAPPIAASEPGEADSDAVVGPLAPPPRRIAARTPLPRREAIEETRDGGARSPSSSDPPKATIVVPASAVARAIEKRDVGATNALAPDGSPLGARLLGVGKYRTGLRDGDVVVSVAGARTPTVEAMVAVGLRAAGGGATALSGRIQRGASTYAVVIELPR